MSMPSSIRAFCRHPPPQLPPSVTGEGTVIAVVPASQQLVVEHGDITGFMEAMTMGYKVNPPSLLDTLKAGDTIRFTIDTQRRPSSALKHSKSNDTEHRRHPMSQIAPQ